MDQQLDLKISPITVEEIYKMYPKCMLLLIVKQ